MPELIRHPVDQSFPYTAATSFHWWELLSCLFVLQ